MADHLPAVAAPTDPDAQADAHLSPSIPLSPTVLAPVASAPEMASPMGGGVQEDPASTTGTTGGVSAAWLSAKLRVTVEAVLSTRQEEPRALTLVETGRPRRRQVFVMLPTASPVTVERDFNREAFFYGNISRLLPLKLPNCLYAGDDGIIIEDLAATMTGVAQATPTLSMPEAHSIMRALGTLHGKTWEAESMKDPVFSERGAYLDGFTSPEGIQNQVQAGVDALKTVQAAAMGVEPLLMPTEVWATTAVLVERCVDFAEVVQSKAVTLSHGDINLDHILLVGSGAGAILLGWRQYCLGFHLLDVAMALSQINSGITDRAKDNELLASYLEALNSSPGFPLKGMYKMPNAVADHKVAVSWLLINALAKWATAPPTPELRQRTQQLSAAFARHDCATFARHFKVLSTTQ